MKLSGVVTVGSEAKELILGKRVKVNGEICTARGKKLHTGDVIEYKDNIYKVEST